MNGLDGFIILVVTLSVIYSILNRLKGCIFAPRCQDADGERCTPAPIPTAIYGDSGHHRVKCARVSELPKHERPSSANLAAAATTSHTEAVLTLDGLKKTYHQAIGMFGATGYDVHAVDDIDLAAERAETLAIVGESGCGKSTLAKVLTGIELATGGKVILAGKDIGNTAVEKRDSDTKRSIQMVFQNPESTLNPRGICKSAGFS